MRLGNDTVYRLRAPTAEDGFGNPVRNWVDPPRDVIENCSIQPVIGDEETVGRDTVVSRWRLFVPPDTDLLSSDRIEYDGDDYEVDGDVQRWGTATRGYLTCLLQKVT